VLLPKMSASTTLTSAVPAKTITTLVMRSPEQLVRARPAPKPITMERAGPEEAALVRSTYNRIWKPLPWSGRSGWSEIDWVADIENPDIHMWIAWAGGEVLGMIELESGPGDDAGIVVIGVVPERIGQGFGGDLLTRATEMAWELTGEGESQPSVWIETSSTDHPHALPNYRRRGFTIARTTARE
jgi:GNAT superfamily N-acetyltransferase